MGIASSYILMNVCLPQPKSQAPTVYSKGSHSGGGYIVSRLELVEIIHIPPPDENPLYEKTPYLGLLVITVQKSAEVPSLLQGQPSQYTLLLSVLFIRS